MADIKLNQHTAKLKEGLEEAERRFGGTDDVFGMTALTNPGYISGARSIMFTNHLKQLINLENPDYPLVSTNYENVVGRNNTTLKKAKQNWTVDDKIYKFDGDHQMYVLFLYDEENNQYHAIQKKCVENLTEKFGFRYNTEKMDKMEVGDEIKKGETIYKSSSYDEDDNYCYGKNATFMYLIDSDTIEDAIKVSESFANSLLSTEVETVTVSLNDNDILCNIYGDDDLYKVFPDIGEYVKDKTVCCKRRIFNEQLLYDFKKSNLRKIDYSNDTLALCDGRITDITIYCNKDLDEIPDNPMYEQIKKYYDNEMRYYKELYDKTKEIVESGAKYTREVDYIYKKSREILDEHYKWRKTDGSVFNNIVIQFEIVRSSKLGRGSKCTGRYGNKGVVSTIVPDDEMPITENGDRVDVIFNVLGVPNRLNTFQLIEQSINFVTEHVVRRLATMESLEEKEKLLFDIVGRFNSKQKDAMKKFYKKLKPTKKDLFFQQIQEFGIYIHIPPLWEERPIFDTLSDLYKDYPWIKPYKVYIKKFGRMIPMMNRMVVSKMYVMKLKQTASKNFSVRSTGSLSKKGLPEKTDNAKDNKTSYKDTPVKLGIDEDLNLMICTPAEEIVKLHMFYRNAINGRKSLGESLMTEMDTIEDFKMDDGVKNRNVEILQARFKAMGLKLVFGKETLNIEVDGGQVYDEVVDGTLVIGDLNDINEFKMRNMAKQRVNEELFVGSVDEYNVELEKRYKEVKDEVDASTIMIKWDGKEN